MLLTRYCAVLGGRVWLVRYNPAVGYCQSMNFIAALLLIILDVHEEHSFWMLVLLVSMAAESRSLCMLCGMVSYHTYPKASCSGTVQSNEVWLYVSYPVICAVSRSGAHARAVLYRCHRRRCTLPITSYPTILHLR